MVHWTPLIIHMIGACACTCVCALHCKSNQGRMEQTASTPQQIKVSKGEECGRRVNITCKTHKVSRILHQAQTDICKASSNRLIVLQQMFAFVKMTLSPPTPSSHSGTLCHHVIFSSKLVVFHRSGRLLTAADLLTRSHYGKTSWILVPRYKLRNSTYVEQCKM